MRRTITCETAVDVTIDQMAEWFSEMDDAEQVNFLNAAVKHMDRWPLQWDAISRKLDEPENHPTRAILRALTETINVE